jgi:flavin reductase (DIM6/NTAB) family NADH-FMN oxidoreductase RutF
MKKSIGAKTIVYPTPVFVVGTYDEDGKPNLMTVAWGGICCSSPPCVAISLRKERHTFGNITATKAFTVNIPSQSQVAVADYIGCVSGKREDKFAVAGLTPVKSEIVNAPFVKEFPMALECKVIHVIEIGIHTQFIGEILDIKVDEDRLGDNNLPDIEKVKPFIYVPDRNAYYGIGEYLAKAFSIGKEIKKQ